MGTNINGTINQLIKNYNKIAAKTGKATIPLGTFSPAKTTPFGTLKSAASGFEGLITRPTTFLTGEAGAEHVSITPVGSSGGGQQIIQYITVQGSILAERDVEKIANNALKRDLKRVGF